ncbi:hypothetical protein WG909_10260 [Peptostreptococcaceae bacterium AGR-M142]
MNLIIINKNNNKKENANIKKLNLNDFDKVAKLQDISLKNLKRKDFCVELTKDELKAILTEGRGFTYGVFVNNSLISFYSVLFPNEEEYLGKDIDIPKENINISANLEITHTLSNYQGNKFQKILCKLCLEEIQKNYSHIRYIMATIAPGNYSSMASTLCYNIYAFILKNKYNNLKRYILLQDLKSEFKLDENSLKIVSGDDLVLQKELFSKDYVIHNIFIQNNETKFKMSKLKS